MEKFVVRLKRRSEESVDDAIKDQSERNTTSTCLDAARSLNLPGPNTGFGFGFSDPKNIWLAAIVAAPAVASGSRNVTFKCD
ncbi:hypothetical protein NQ318_011500 [Aromia moschata]|uniref:Uncharacterized protein n=1 Tax=Aromia moschata TaxID=1265417 RepID=A0AAV8XR68_9CUCU|nr:hypothetical protein NQ318_011500 [Aromia moschata]